MIPSVLDSLHQRHPRQSGMLRLTDLVWFPRIHRDVTAKIQSCGDYIKKCKNLNANNIKTIPTHTIKTNRTKRRGPIRLCGPIPSIEHKLNYYIIDSVDRLPRYSHAQVYKVYHTQTALNYLKDYCRLHGIPRSTRCGQAKALKSSRNWNLFTKLKKTN